MGPEERLRVFVAAFESAAILFPAALEQRKAYHRTYDRVLCASEVVEGLALHSE